MNAKDPAALDGIAAWHDQRAEDLDRCAYNAETANWREACQRRATFHRTAGRYLRAVYAEMTA